MRRVKLGERYVVVVVAVVAVVAEAAAINHVCRLRVHHTPSASRSSTPCTTASSCSMLHGPNTCHTTIASWHTPDATPRDAPCACIGKQAREEGEQQPGWEGKRDKH